MSMRCLCDRCGAVINKHIVRTLIVKDSSNNNRQGRTLFKGDLCPHCSDLLSNFIKDGDLYDPDDDLFQIKKE